LHQYQPKVVGNGINDTGSSNTRPSAPENHSTDKIQPPIKISDLRSQEIYDLVRNRFNETDLRLSTDANSLLGRDRGQNFGVLSRTMMQTYIDNFWCNFHPQLPICE
jgi:hypothetical protein